MKKKKKQKSEPPKGPALLDEVIRMTGIPAKAMRRELNCLIEKTNLDPKDLTLDQLRVLAVNYLREIMGGMVDAESKSRSHH